MIITNKSGMPSAIVEAIKKNTFTKGQNYSASMMFSPIQKVQLERRHWHEIEQDAADMIWLLLGSAVHHVIGQGTGSHELSEEYLKAEIIPGVTVSGVFDCFSDGKIYDYKFTSTWTWVFLKDKIGDYSDQLNVYRWLLEKQGFTVDGLRIVLIFKDWMRGKALSEGYPPNQVEIVEIPIDQTIGARMVEYVTKAESYKETPDDQLPECTLEERWGSLPKFAVVKKGAKRALRVLDTKEAAVEYIGDQAGFEIEERPGELWKRCEYCGARAFCAQYRRGHEN